MKHLLIAILGALTIGLEPGAAYAADKQHREASAHTHGHGKANIAVEGKRLFIELEAPGADIVGFERAPSTDAEKAAVATAKAVLENPLDVIELPVAAGCKNTKSSVELRRDGEHGEFHAAYEFECSAMTRLDQIKFSYFRLFKSAEELEIAVITDTGAQKLEVTRQQPVVHLGALL